jgi:hypothetical protein
MKQQSTAVVKKEEGRLILLKVQGLDSLLLRVQG